MRESIFQIVLFGLIAAQANIPAIAAKPLNHFQIIGSHNSYKRAMPQDALKYVAAHDPKLAAAIDYSHESLNTQLNTGIRHLEIDLLLDPKGGKFAEPKIEKVLNQRLLSDAERAHLTQKGLKVLHIPDVDMRSHCQLFKKCLGQLLNWSNAHPEHFLLIIMLNIKESRAAFVDGVQPLIFTAKDYTAIDNEIRQVVPANKLLTPDDVRGKFASLEEAVLTQGWPDVKKLKGKFLFLFDGSARQRALYLIDHPALTGRAMFASYSPGQPEAAFLIINDPLKNFQQIQLAVQQGYMVRTRSDANLSATNAFRTIRKQAAFDSGAQIISSDFYYQSPQAKAADYSVIFNTGHLIRNNPITPALK